jgi:hypothetical protein
LPQVAVSAPILPLKFFNGGSACCALPAGIPSLLPLASARHADGRYGRVLLVPLDSPGCDAPAMALVRGETQPPPYVVPVQSSAEIQADDNAVASAQALVDERTRTVTAAEAQLTAAQAARKRADAAEAAAQEAEANVTSSEATTAQWDVDSAESSVKVAQDNVTFWEGFDITYGAEELKQAKADLATAKADLEQAKATLKSAQSKSSAAASARASARDTANSLSTKADAAEKSADAAVSAARSDLVDAESNLLSAQQTKEDHAAEHSRIVSGAFATHRSALRTVEAENAVRADCRVNARPDIAAAGLLTLTTLAIGIMPLIRRRRTKRQPVEA